jgi:hypothetical protein
MLLDLLVITGGYPVTFTRSVLFASLLTAAAFGCRSKTDDRSNNFAPKPVESTTTEKVIDQEPPAADKNTNPEAAAPGAAGSAATPESATGTEGSAATPGSATGTEGSAAMPEGTTPGSSEATGMGTYGSAMGSAAAPTETGSAAVPSSTEPDMNAGSDLNTGSATNAGSDQGTLDKRGGALNGDLKGDQSNQP